MVLLLLSILMLFFLMVVGRTHFHIGSHVLTGNGWFHLPLDSFLMALTLLLLLSCRVRMLFGWDSITDFCSGSGFGEGCAWKGRNVLFLGDSAGVEEEDLMTLGDSGGVGSRGGVLTLLGDGGGGEACSLDGCWDTGASSSPMLLDGVSCCCCGGGGGGGGGGISCCRVGGGCSGRAWVLIVSALAGGIRGTGAWVGGRGGGADTGAGVCPWAASIRAREAKRYHGRIGGWFSIYLLIVAYGSPTLYLFIYICTVEMKWRVKMVKRRGRY